VGVGVGGDASVSMPQRVPGGRSRIATAVPLQNQHSVPPGVHRDIERPVPVTAGLHWEAGTETPETVALEWTLTLVRIRILDLRVMTGAVWIPAGDVHRRQP
jgi:hypothetical protein